MEPLLLYHGGRSESQGQPRLSEGENHTGYDSLEVWFMGGGHL